MVCLPTETPTELEFIQALVRRRRVINECQGPLLRIAMWPYRVFLLESILDSSIASDMLWSGHCNDGCMGVHFELCGAHWMDLVILCEVRAFQYNRRDWQAEAEQLHIDVCRAGGWDPKEMLNMIMWQRERLT